MGLTQENKLEERMDHNLRDEEKWWILFGLAYPDIPPHEINQLKAEYPLFPCMLSHYLLAELEWILC